MTQIIYVMIISSENHEYVQYKNSILFGNRIYLLIIKNRTHVFTYKIHIVNQMYLKYGGFHVEITNG